MKNLYLLLAAILLATGAWCQVPQKMAYQSIIRDQEGFLVTEQNIGIQVSIVAHVDSLATFFVERHFPQTNVNGLATFFVGEGTVIEGSLDLDWGAGDYFVKTEVDLRGGSDYTIEAVTQLVSVPYAFHAGNTDQIEENVILLTGSVDNLELSVSKTENTVIELTEFVESLQKSLLELNDSLFLLEQRVKILEDDKKGKPNK